MNAQLLCIYPPAWAAHKSVPGNTLEATLLTVSMTKPCSLQEGAPVPLKPNIQSGLQVRVEQVLMATPPLLLCFSLSQLLGFYTSLVDRLLGNSASLTHTLAGCRQLASRIFREQLKAAGDKLMRYPPSPPKDLSPPQQVGLIASPAAGACCVFAKDLLTYGAAKFLHLTLASSSRQETMIIVSHPFQALDLQRLSQERRLIQRLALMNSDTCLLISQFSCSFLRLCSSYLMLSPPLRLHMKQVKTPLGRQNLLLSSTQLLSPSLRL